MADLSLSDLNLLKADLLFFMVLKEVHKNPRINRAWLDSFAAVEKESI